MEPLAIGIIGGTGPQGRGLAMRLALTRQVVWVGSRQAEKAQAAAAELNGRLRAHDASLSADKAFPWIAGCSNADTVRQSTLVMLTVPFESALPTLQDLLPHFQPGAIFVDVTVPLDFSRGDVQLLSPPEGSGSKHLRAVLPAAVPLVGACKTLPAEILEQLGVPLDCSAFVFGDSKEAKATVIQVLAGIPRLRPLDVGGLSAAATVEGMTALLIRINRRHKVHGARFSVVGLEG
ncbi:MAG TPA: NADPH-dependent F420 reductase [bacterium]|nr:NADPH-dependent F420 reductase [bacterium]